MKQRLLVVLTLLFAQGCANQRVRFERFVHYAPYRFSGPAPQVKCRSSGKWKWCVDTPRKSMKTDRETILYVLHHAGASERTWGEFPVARKFYSWFKKRGVPAPRVVSVSYGPYWTLMEEPGKTQPALLRPFVDEVMPEIERGFKFSPSKRLLWGTSQGGLNGASLILREPDLFSRAVLSCPAIFAFPMYSDSQADAYIERNDSVRRSVYWGLKKLRPRIGGAEAWAREAPLVLIENAESLPPTFVQINPGDEYGFQDGGRKFAETAQSRGLPVTLKSGGWSHCVFDIESAIEFLIAQDGLQ